MIKIIVNQTAKEHEDLINAQLALGNTIQSVNVTEKDLVTVINLVSHKLSYDNNGGTGSVSAQDGADVVVKNSTGLTAPTDKTFSKWNTKADGTGTDRNPGDSLTLTADVTLYAIWVDAE